MTWWKVFVTEIGLKATIPWDLACNLIHENSQFMNMIHLAAWNCVHWPNKESMRCFARSSHFNRALNVPIEIQFRFLAYNKKQLINTNHSDKWKDTLPAHSITKSWNSFIAPALERQLMRCQQKAANNNAHCNQINECHIKLFEILAVFKIYSTLTLFHKR